MTLRRQITQLNTNRVVRATVLYVGTDTVSVRLTSGHILRGIKFVGRPVVQGQVNVSFATGNPIAYAGFSDVTAEEMNYMFYMECDPTMDLEFTIPPFDFTFPPFPPLPPFPPNPEPPGEPPGPQLTFTLSTVYVLTDYNRILGCANIGAGPAQVWTDVTPAGGITFSRHQNQVDWTTKSLYIASLDGKAYYRSSSVSPMYKWLDATTFPFGGTPADNEARGLSINPVTGESIMLLYNPSVSSAGVCKGTTEELAYVGQSNLDKRVVTQGGNPFVTIGNGRVVLTVWWSSLAGGRLYISDDGGIGFTEKTTIPFHEWFDRTWHVRPNPIGNILYYSQQNNFSALTKSENLADTAVRLTGPASAEGFAVGMSLDGLKLASTSGGKRTISLDGGLTFDTEPHPDFSTGLKIMYIWAGHSNGGSDLWLLLCMSGDQFWEPGSKDTIYASVDNCQTYTEIGVNLKQAIIDGGHGTNMYGDPYEHPVRMWVTL